MENWVKEECKDFEVWSPMNGTEVLTGLGVIGGCPGTDVGTYRYTEGGGIVVTLNRMLDIGGKG